MVFYCVRVMADKYVDLNAIEKYLQHKKYPNEGGGVVFAGGREMKIFSTVFRESGNGICNTKRCR